MALSAAKAERAGVFGSMQVVGEALALAAGQRSGRFTRSQVLSA
jgi:hypothetical protein